MVPEHLVEDNAQLEAIMKLLDVGSAGVCFVGVHGMGGIGKTTLTTVLYNKLSSHFEGCCFLQDVRVHWQPPSGPLDLQKKLLLHFVGSSITDQIKDADGGMKMIKRVLCMKRVLLVLDDVDDEEQFEKLAGKFDWFGSGSRIIITTRDERIFTTQVESSSTENRNQPKEILRYAIQRNDNVEALSLTSNGCNHNLTNEELTALPKLRHGKRLSKQKTFTLVDWLCSTFRIAILKVTGMGGAK
ncbi:hypothetical protein BT93_C1645 [Corymbia citriodora subsp. variegata]|nr:hypothetical protein BT93_C1645 [Corymbia citriodora subsp. variegata]